MPSSFIGIRYRRPTGPVVVSGELPDGEIGEPYAPFSYVASGEGYPYTFSLASGSLPPGLTLNADGSVTGTPTAAGTFSWTVRATGYYGATGDHDDGCSVAGTYWLYALVSATGIDEVGTRIARVRDPTDWSSKELISLPGGMLDMTRLSVANNVVFIHNGDVGGNAWVSFDGCSTFQEADNSLYNAANETYPVYHNGAYYYWRGLYSDDALTWVAVPNLPAVTIISWFARPSDGAFLIAASNGNIYTTLNNGASWTTRTNPYGGSSFYPFESNGARVAGAAGDGIGYGYSDDLFATAASASATGPGVSLKYANGAWVGRRIELMRSTDGASFAQVLAVAGAGSNFGRYADFGDDVWVWADKTANHTTQIYTSADNALTWTPRDIIKGFGESLAFVDIG